MGNAIDVIVPTYGRSSCIHKCISSILPQLQEQDNLFIVWQGTQKPEVREAKNVHSLYSSPPNLPRARNKGVLAGENEIVLFFDDDVVIGPGVLECHRNAHVDISIGAVAGKIIDPLFPTGQSAPSTYDESTGRIIQSFNVDKSQFTISLMGAHMSFKREAILRINGFDEQFKRNALWEEVDAAFRIRLIGYKLWYCAEAVVDHLREQHGGCRSDTPQKYLFNQFANTTYFAAKHARRQYWNTWLTYWKYRLEYETRSSGVFKHSPIKVLSGVLGAIAGLLRYWTIRCFATGSL